MYDSVDQIHTSQPDEPLSTLRFVGGVEAACNSITDLGSDRYQLGYAGVSITAIVEILPVSKVIDSVDTGWFRFTLLSTRDPLGERGTLRFLEVCRFYTTNCAQRFTNHADGLWAVTAAADDLFMYVLPMNTDAAARTGYADTIPYYSFRAVKEWGMDGAQAAFVTAPKGVYYETLEALVDNDSLPKRVDFNGDWFTSTAPKHRSYMFDQLTPANTAEILAATVRGGFPVMLDLSPLQRGYYNVPADSTFANLAALQSALTQFTAVGIDVGFHGYWGRVDEDDDLFQVRYLRKIRLGALASGISDAITATTIQIDLGSLSKFNEDAEFLYYRDEFATADKVLITIGDEIILAPATTAASVDTDTFAGCTRGHKGTTRAVHSAGAAVDVLVMSDETSQPYANDAGMLLAAEAFADATRTLGVDLFYADGNLMPDYNTNGFGVETRANDERVIVYPFLDAVAKTDAGVRDWDRLPETGYGSSRVPAAWQYFDRLATSDGVAFKTKDDLRDRKNRLVSYSHNWSIWQYEFGWFRAYDGGIGSTIYDFDALSWDDVHYLFTKMVAFDVSVGFQPQSTFYTHGQRDDLLDLMAVYHEMNDRDRVAGVGTVFSSALRTTMQTGTVEGELRDTDADGVADEFVRKVVTRYYAIWTGAAVYTSTFTQTYTSPTFKIELRARPDFKGFGHADNDTLAATADFTSGTITTSSASVTATIDAAGDVEIANTGASTGWVQVALDGGPFNLTAKRGVGFKLTGDAANDASVRVKWGSNPRRQFTFTATDGVQTEILADTNYEDTSSIGDHGIFNLSSATVAVIVYDIPAGRTLSMNFDSMEALAEKADSSRIVDPVITINGRRIVASNVTLETSRTAAYLLEYDSDTGDWGIRSSDRDEVAKPATATLTFPDGAIQLVSGANSVTVTSDTAYGLRAELWVHVYDTPNHFPVLGSIGDQSVQAGQALTFDLSATDADGDALTYAGSGLPTGAALAGSTFTWGTATTDVGDHSMTFSVSDGSLGDYEVVTVTVEPYGYLGITVSNGPAFEAEISNQTALRTEIDSTSALLATISLAG